mmetsp:Transcript_56285/g.132631  ORF Transcript_56285/g.132631 Transcript_56285/m.132631 type:complete len:383 (-) Transcript_56285:217-1365(-)
MIAHNFPVLNWRSCCEHFRAMPNTMFLAVLLLAFGGAQVGSADHGGVSLADQAKLVFEADYFTAGTEPSLQLECVGSECEGNSVQLVQCSQQPSSKTAAAVVQGCPQSLCGRWFCEAEDLNVKLSLNEVTISCEWTGEGWVRKGSCALRHRIMARADLPKVEEQAEANCAKESVVGQEKAPDEPISTSSPPQVDGVQELVESNIGMEGFGAREVLAAVLAAVGSVIFCVFSCKNRWKQQVSTQTITQEERKDIAKLFAQIDTDGSGGLDADEMKVALVNLGFRGVTDQQLNALMCEADLDGNGQIEEEELVALLQRYKTSGKVDFRSTIQHVLSRDMQHFRRNWFDELKQWSSLVLLMGLMMLVLLKLGEFAERAKKGDAKL